MTREDLMEMLEDSEWMLEVVCEELDDYTGLLGDDRYHDMSEINDIFYDKCPEEIFELACNSEDEYGGAFDVYREYFKFDGYGNLISADCKDYSDYLDDYLIDEMLDHYQHCQFPNEVNDAIEQIIEAEKTQPDGLGGSLPPFPFSY